MIVVNRFRVTEAERPEFEARAGAAVALLATRAGARAVDLVQNLDDPALWAIVSVWDQVGSYRRALNGYESKVTIVPLLSLAVDEPSAYADPVEVGENRPRGL